MHQNQKMDATNFMEHMELLYEERLVEKTSLNIKIIEVIHYTFFDKMYIIVSTASNWKLNVVFLKLHMNLFKVVCETYGQLIVQSVVLLR